MMKFEDQTAEEKWVKADWHRCMAQHCQNLIDAGWDPHKPMPGEAPHAPSLGWCRAAHEMLGEAISHLGGRNGLH
jgi:hypothetical protein